MAPTGLFCSSSSSSLSRLEDEQVAAFAKNGCSDATEYLLRKYRGFVEGKARSYFLAGAEQEDVIQEGMIGLYKAIRDFRADALARFRSFAELCIMRQIVTAVKTATRNKHVPLNDYLSLQQNYGDENGGGCLMDIVADTRVADPERIVLERRRMQRLEAHAQQSLSDLEAEALDGYLEGKSYREMASNLRRPAKAIDNALQRAKRKIGQCVLELN